MTIETVHSATPTGVADFYSGLDLGQVSDYSALVVCERTVRPHPTRPGEPQYVFAMRHAHRWPLGTAYTEIVRDLKALFEVPPLKGSTLAVDRTGVGRGVFDMVREAELSAAVRGYSITAGWRPSAGGGVPKRDLVAVVQSALQERRLKLADALPLTPVLMAELENFKVKVTDDRNETYGCWREGTNDDCVIALALALYVGRGSLFAFATVDIPTSRTFSSTGDPHAP